MNSQKLIMEGWRRFILEQQERGSRIPDEKVCLRVEIERDENAQFTLYTPGDGDTVADQVSGLRIIGSVSLENLEDSGPCLSGEGKRPTWHVLSIHTNPAFRKVGYGSMLYGFAFLIADRNNAGLTSDKYVGSKSDAKEKWNSFESDASSYEQTYTFVQTPDGSMEFDYDGTETPNDPNDDCDVMVPSAENASDHSFIHKDPSIYEDSIQVYEANHLDFEEEVVASGTMTYREFDRFLTQIDLNSFDKSYGSGESS